MAAIEVITSVERRRRWSRDEKLRIVAESARPDRTASQVARDHGIAPGQLFTWRRQLVAEARMAWRLNSYDRKRARAPRNDHRIGARIEKSDKYRHWGRLPLVQSSRLP